MFGGPVRIGRCLHQPDSVCPKWTEEHTQVVGWIALALVVLCHWKAMAAFAWVPIFLAVHITST